MEEKISKIKSWLGTGSINIFGLPMSGKDTQGIKLAEAIGGKFLSSGMIIREAEVRQKEDYTGNGNLAPSNVFYDCVLPYFERRDLFSSPLVLSSIGRWSGEETAVMNTAANAGHEIKAVIILNVSEAEVERRWENAKQLGDRGDRNDDRDSAVFQNRILEFRQKTLPVIQHYKDLGLLIDVPATGDRDEIFSIIIDKLADFAEHSSDFLD